MDPTVRKRIGNTGVEVTALGCGGAPFGNLYARVDDEAVAQAVLTAYDAGIRYFDTAPFYGYGLSEQRLGRALRSLPRDSYVLSSKVGRVLEPRRSKVDQGDGFVDPLPFEPVYDYSRDGVMRSLGGTLERLGCERLDVCFLHDVGALTHGEDHPGRFAEAMKGGYEALAELRAGGQIGAIGLGVNEWEVCLEAMSHGDFDCFLLAGRYTLLDQSSLEHLLPACEAREIAVIVGGPYNSGILASEPGPEARFDYAPASDAVLTRARRIFEICKSHDVPLQAAALQFPVQHPQVASVIPGARSAAEVEQNVGFFEHPIPPALWRDLKTARAIDMTAPTGDASS